jgi:hypothetical protein
MLDLVAWRTEELPAEGRQPRCWLSVGWGERREPEGGFVFKTLFRLEEEEAIELLNLPPRSLPAGPVRVKLRLEVTDRDPSQAP